MKSLVVKMGVALLVVGLTICSSTAWGADWKALTEATTGVFLYDAASINSPSQGLVRVWISNRTKNESNLVELNCKDRTYQVLDVVQWGEDRQIKSRESYYDNPKPNWLNISPGSVPESLYKTVCR